MNNAYRAPWNRRYNPPRQHRWTREYYLAALAIIAIALISWTVAAEVPTGSPHTSRAEVTRQAKKINVTLGDR